MALAFIVSGSTWSGVATNGANIAVEIIGDGGGGFNGNAGIAGGGGAYAKKNSLAYTSGASVSIQTGTGGVGGNTGGNGTDWWFSASGTVLAKAGTGGATTGAGGLAASSVGDTTRNGGNSGATQTSGNGGDGAGGAAGPSGVGANGGTQAGGAGSNGGSGGGGNGGGSAGAGPATAAGTVGGNNAASAGAGTAGASSTTANGGIGGSGSAGGGGGGGGSTTASGFACGAGGPGGNGTEWDATHGSGGGGGAGAGRGAASVPTGGNGGAGGLYGGGGGAGGFAATTNGQGGNGGQGIIVVTYTPFSFIVWEDDRSGRPVHRPFWRPNIEARGDIAELPFTATVTPTRYYEEEPHRRPPARRANPRSVNDDALVPPTPAPQVAAEIDYARIRRSPWRKAPPPEDIAGLPFTATVTPTAYYEEEQHKQERRRSWRAAAQPLADEFLFNPTQIQFAAWGFEEEQHRQERRVFHRLTQQEDPLGIPQLVGVNWSFEEEQHRQQRRIFHRLVQQDDPLGISQLAGVEWGFEEEQHRQERRIFHRLLQQEDPLGIPQLVGVGWGFEEEQHRQERRIFHRLVQQDDPLGIPQLVGVPWALDGEIGRQIRRRVWRAFAQPLVDEFLFNATQIAFAAWGFDEEQHRQQRRLYHRLTSQDDTLPLSVTPIVVVPWAFEGEAGRQIRRRAWRAFPYALTDEFLFNPTQVSFAAWGFETLHQRVSRRAWRPSAQQDADVSAAGRIVYVDWGDQAPRVPTPRLWRPSPYADDWIASSPQSLPWFDDVQILPRRFRATPRGAADEFIQVPSVVAWQDIDQAPRSLRRALRPALGISDDLIVIPLPAAIPWLDRDARRRPLLLYRRNAALLRDEWLFPLRPPAPIPPLPPIPVGMAACDMRGYLPEGVTVRRVISVSYFTRWGFDAVAASRFNRTPYVLAQSVVVYPYDNRIFMVEIEAALSDGTSLSCVDVLMRNVI